MDRRAEEEDRIFRQDLPSAPVVQYRRHEDWVSATLLVLTTDWGKSGASVYSDGTGK
jgi:hypothetical protein